MRADHPVEGKKFSQRSSDILNKGEQAEIVNAVLSNLGLLDSPGKLIGGYDHGASIALRMAAKWPSRFAKVVAFHPTLGNKKPE